MPYRREVLTTILLMSRETRDHEIGCDDCWEEFDRLAELVLLGHRPEQIVPLVDVHLRNCPECAEEFRALLDSLRSTTPRHSLQQDI